MNNETLVQNGSDGESFPLADARGSVPGPDGGEGETAAATKHERASVGKIARLPKAIREMLNRRLEDGEPAASLAAWLIELPPVQTVMASYFRGAAISEKNISNWRLGGFKRWQEKQELLAEVRELSEEAADLNEANPDGLMRMTATLACTKLLRSLRDDKTDVTKAAFAIAALNNVEMSHIRVEHEERRLAQKDSMEELAWDKHLRNCVEIGHRLMTDWKAKEIHQAPVDYSYQIEMLGRHMFGDLWRKRRLPGEAEIIEELEQKAREAKAGKDIEQKETKTTEADWTDGTDEPVSDLASSLPNSYAGKFTQELIAEAEAKSTCPNLWREKEEPKKTAEQELSLTMTAVSPAMEVASGKTGETPIPLAGSEHPPQTPKRELSPYEKALLEGKLFIEALYAQQTPVPKPKAGTQNELQYRKPGWGDAVSEPVHYAPGPSSPLPPSTDGPCGPPLTSASLRNLW